MGKVRLGIIGVGYMGGLHIKSIQEGKVPSCELTAICDVDPNRLEKWKNSLPGSISFFLEAEELMNSGKVDAVLIATPHYIHPDLAIQAFAKGLHVLTEKPAGVYTGQVKKMNDAARKSGKVFGIMYNQRTNPVYATAKKMISRGDLGELIRVTWTITDWYRTQAYYNSGGWRGTWEGEGGGVLLNQDPHQLDLLQWLCGMPVKVRSFCSFGAFHDVQIEDDVTAVLKYENGATGVFISSTGEYPGCNRLEISGDLGRLVIEHDTLIFHQLKESLKHHRNTCPGKFDTPECWTCQVPVLGENSQHVGILNNFMDAILNGAELLAPGEEGINGLSLSNAIHLSSFLDDWVELPVEEELFLTELKKRWESGKGE